MKRACALSWNTTKTHRLEVKRRDVVRHLEKSGCELLREGSNHTIYVNRAKGKASSVPWHREINDFLVVKICRDLEIPDPNAA